MQSDFALDKFVVLKNYIQLYIKAAVCKYCLFVAISVENLVLQPGAELSLLRGLFSGTASARMNLMF